MELPRLSSQRRTQLAQATERYAEALVGSAAEGYLAGRGVSAEVAARFQLGFVAEGSPVEGHDRFAGRLAIPYITPSGVVGMRFRRLDGEDPKSSSSAESSASPPKYDSEAGQRTALYNVNDLHRSEPWIALCEGELDTVVMSGIVGVPAVGVPGVEHWGKKGGIWSRLLQDYEQVFVVMDPDRAGRKFVPEICKQIENAIPVDLPADVNDTVLQNGPEWVLEKMGLD